MTTTFFDRQRDLRKMSFRLVLLFALAVILIVATVNLVVLFAFGALTAGQEPTRIAAIVAVTSLLTAGTIGLATLYRMATLRGGGGRVARELGGDHVPHDTTDPQLRRLRNVVEEISIASGVPVPEIYVLQNESAINAFAAGWSTSDAAVAVTRGALESLNRDELQGVIAHEFSHVVNGDMRLNIRLIGLLFGILFLAVAGQTILRAGFFTRSRDEKSGGNPLPLIGLALVAAGYAGVLIGRVIKASVSRKREYLADASAVQYTRQPQGIAGALKKIAGLPTGSGLRSPKTEEVAHMLFGSGSRKLQSLFATHPPLADRIKALDPTFDPAQLAQLAQDWAQSPPNGLAEDRALGLTSSARPQTATQTAQPPTAAEAPQPQTPAGAGRGQSGQSAQSAQSAQSVVSRVGSPNAQGYQRAASLLEGIDAGVRARARSVEQVVPLVLGLLVSSDERVSAKQREELTARLGPQMAQAVFDEAVGLATLDPALRLPLAEISFPALRYRPQAQQAAVLDAVQVLIQADGRISTFEYCFSAMLHSELYQSLHPPPHWHMAPRSLGGARSQVVTLLRVLADSEAAFQAGLRVAFPEATEPYRPTPAPALEDGWHVLRELRPEGKEQLIKAAVAVIDHDRAMTVDEFELLRTICGLLHCPLPPLASAVPPGHNP